MKKNILFSLLIAGTGLILSVTGCKKDDTTAPVITVSGASSLELSLGSVSTWTDLGATATDDVDGTLTPTSDASSTNPNMNLVGTYTITYTATDKAGNVGTAIRTIRVKNDAENYQGNYMVHDSLSGLPAFPDYAQAITVDNAVNNRVHFSRFGDYANNTTVYGTRLGSGDLEIPNQTAANIGSGTGSCAVSTHSFSTISPATLGTSGFTINYNDAVTAPSTCVSASTGTAVYTRQ